MSILKFLFFILFLILVVFIANIINGNREAIVEVKEDNSLENVFSYDASNVLIYDLSEIRSIAGIDLNSSYTNLTTSFGIDINNIDNSILRKVVKVLNYDADIVVFPKNNAIEQITLKVQVPVNDTTSIELFIGNVVDAAKIHSMPASIEKIEDIDGNIIADIIIYNTTKYKFIMTKSIDNNELIFIIDVINNFS